MWIPKRLQCSTLFTSEMESLIGNGGYSGVLLTDLSKAFDCLVHDLLTGAMTAYGFYHNVTQLIHSYLTNPVIKQLEKDSRILLEWVTNPDKFHLLLSSVDKNLSIIAEQHEISSSCNEKLLGITIDKTMSFDEHVLGLCTKASQKLHTPYSKYPLIDIIKCSTIMNSFINSQFSYCPLVWMFHNRILNNTINKIHERASQMNCLKITLSCKEYPSLSN